jgi:Tfp pilus assembly protein PilZ
MAGSLDPSPVAPRARLRVVFTDAEVFRREFESNLSNGGLFVPCERPFEPREVVEVEVSLRFCNEIVVLDAEVVFWRPADLGGGTEAGVAVQILTPAREVRDRFQRFVPPTPRAIPTPPGVERRRTPRAPSQVGAVVAKDEGRASARTRDLSSTGALIDVHGDPPAVGDEVQVTLVHPTHGDERRVTGRVVRHDQATENGATVAVQFVPEDGQELQVERFVEDVQAADHARRLGAIAGPVADLGVASLLQMFGMSAPRGTLLLTREGEAGSISFEGGMLRSARVGGASGLKALGRLLGWRDGSFEFRAGFDAADAEDAPVALDAAILESMRQADELGRFATAALPPTTRLRIVRARLDAQASELGKTEQAVLDLVSAGLPLGRLLDVIPVPDAEIHAAVSSLLERGVLVTPR